jgi:hypothetical protein
VNGTYDAPTLAAVHAFQIKYAGDILTPWGISKSTGFTYLTTRKKINEVYCRNTKQFPLTGAEQQTIQKSRSPARPAQAAAPTTKQIPPVVAPQSIVEPASEPIKSFWQRILDTVKSAGTR